MFPYVLIAPASRGLSAALARHYLYNTQYAVFATHRCGDEQLIRTRILGTDSGTYQHGKGRVTASASSADSRLTLLSLELTSEQSIASAANQLASRLPSDASLHTAWITGGVLHTEKRPQDINYDSLLHSFQVNVISHLLIIKHFSRFLPEYASNHNQHHNSHNHRNDHHHQSLSPSLTSTHQNRHFARWVHVSARLGSISDNHSGGWYSYRSSKAALNQVIKTFDIQLQAQSRSQSNSNSEHHAQSICVGVHPGTVKTDLSKSYWGQDSKGHRDPELLEPEDSAAKLVNVIENLQQSQRGRVWDWNGSLVDW